MDKAWFIQSWVGNIKDYYFFKKSWAEVGMAPSILQRTKLLVSPLLLTNVGQRVAVKAMQKGKITDYESFRNEITILMQLVQN